MLDIDKVDPTMMYLCLGGVGITAYIINHTTDFGRKKFRVDDIDYTRVTPLKHDMWKEALTQLVPVLIALGPTALLSVKTPLSFFISPIGRIISTWVGCLLYYHVWQPYVSNMLPRY
jgi:hypothetical protein